MQETSAQKQAVLSKAGRPLTFASFTLPVLYGFSFEKFAHGETSMYPVKPFSYSFRAAEEDVIANSVAIDDQFSLLQGGVTYVFQVRNVTPDLTGWVLLEADLISRTGI